MFSGLFALSSPQRVRQCWLTCGSLDVPFFLFQRSEWHLLSSSPQDLPLHTMTYSYWWASKWHWPTLSALTGASHWSLTSCLLFHYIWKLFVVDSTVQMASISHEFNSFALFLFNMRIRNNWTTLPVHMAKSLSLGEFSCGHKRIQSIQVPNVKLNHAQINRGEPP